MSIITDEMDRLKREAISKFKTFDCFGESLPIFELGYAYGIDDARRIQEIIKQEAEKAVDKLEGR